MGGVLHADLGALGRRSRGCFEVLKLAGPVLAALWLRAVFPKGAAAGERYPAMTMGSVPSSWSTSFLGATTR
jgi:hypothetical protein